MALTVSALQQKVNTQKLSFLQEQGKQIEKTKDGLMNKIVMIDQQYPQSLMF